jgi:thioredoxin 1
MLNMVEKFTNEDFKNGVIRHEGLVLVDFYAEWCMPCKMLAPILEEIADEFDDIIVAKVNIDENIDIASELDILNIPTMCVFNNCAIEDRMVGYHSKEQIIDMINGAR